MLDLHLLKNLPSTGEVTACECEGVLRCHDPDMAAKTAQHMLGCSEPLLQSESCEAVRPALGKHDTQQAFAAKPRLPTSIALAYQERGLSGCLQQLSEGTEQGRILGTARVAAKVGLSILQASERITRFTKLDRTLSSRTHASSASSGGGGNSSEITSISWHCSSRRLAVAFSDDSVKIFSQKPLQPVLKHRMQRRVTQVQWLPYSMSVVCVACDAGVLLWSVDPASVVTRPSGACVTLLPAPHTATLSVMSPHPQGTSVACSSGRGVVVWDVALAESVEVQRSGAVTHLLYSPDATKLLVVIASPPTLRVFNTDDWSFQEWVSGSEVSSCAWSPCSSYIAFSTSDPGMLYSVCPAASTATATTLADLSQVELVDSHGQSVRVGGAVSGMTWGGERLVLFFHSCPYLVLFHTLTLYALKIALNGVIKGPDNCTPRAAAFHPSQPSLLTVAWDDGSLQHVPLLYTSRQNTTGAPLCDDTVSNFNLTDVNSSWNASVGLDAPNSSLWPNRSLVS
ncbi:Anaphase-promoting complex subunit 4 WD40 domain [Trinorchestia longiramus]|nr:Anaphase-promoting complex subunit 4 WD40 domain [Trinorchestia longiramus]